MKQHLMELSRSVSGQSNDWNARNVVREYLQARILEGLVRAGAMASLAFLGGTALRFLYGLGRYSEDLDFSLEGDRAGYDPPRWAEKITDRVLQVPWDRVTDDVSRLVESRNDMPRRKDLLDLL